MNISVKLTSLTAAIFLLVGLAGLAVVFYMQGLSQKAAEGEATSVAQTLARSITRTVLRGDSHTIPEGAVLRRRQLELQTFVDDIDVAKDRDIEIVDLDRIILADALRDDAGKPLPAPVSDIVRKTFFDRIPRTIIRTAPDERQLVVPIEDSGYRIVGALLLEYTDLFDEYTAQGRKPLYAVAGVTVAGLLMVCGIGILVFRIVSRPLQRLRDATVAITSGKTGVRVDIDSSDELGELARSFNAMMTQRENSMEQMRESETRFRQVTENISEVFSLRSAPDSKILYVSPVFEEIWGRSCASVYENPQSWAESIHPSDRQQAEMAWTQMAKTGRFDLEYRIVRPDGTIRWIHGRAFPIRNDAGELYRIAGTAEDITEKRLQREKIARLTRIYAVFSGINSAIVHVRTRDELFQAACRIAVTDGAFHMAWIGTFDAVTREGKVAASSGADPRYLEQIHLNAAENSPFRLLPGSRAAREQKAYICNDVKTEEGLAPIKSQLLNEGVRSVAAFPLIVEGKTQAVLTLFAAEPDFFDEQECRLLSELANDISFALDHLAKAESLDYLAYFDSLTGLANRNLLTDRLHQAILNARRRNEEVTLAFLDLDNFKVINDSLGHNSGDELLKTVATRLKSCLRQSDTVARLGGDEFVLLLPTKSAETTIVELMKRIREVVAEPLQLDDRTIRVNCSIGLSVFPQDGDDVETLLRNADAAMYRAKDLGRNTFQFFTADIHERIRQRMDMEASLRTALERDEFELHYQPQVDLRTGRIVGMEALLRWRHPQRGLIAPGHFIQLAEETGLIVPIGEWVLARACAQNKTWQDTGLPAVPVAVNMSAKQCEQRNLDQLVSRVLTETGLPPQYLELELTESVSMARPETMVPLMQRLKDMGVELSIDDFGTGYSSISYLKRFPVDKLKLDISFVREITSDPDNLAISESIITMAHSLRLKVIAEGVETESQLSLLASRRCDQMQGYYFSRPLPADEAAKLLWDDRRLPGDVLSLKGDRPALLVVDDDPDVTALLQQLLLSLDYDLLLTNSVVEAFELLARHDVGVVMSDLSMPGMDGVEFLSRIRSMYPGVVRIMMTAVGDFNAARAAINRGAVYKFITKEWDRNDLTTTLEDAFEAYRQGNRQ